MDELVPVALFVCIAFITVGVTRIVSDGRTRRKLIEAGATQELAAAVAQATRDHSSADDSLKWGMVIGAVGLALIVLQFLPYTVEDPISLGLVLVSGAAGLLGHHAITRRAISEGQETRRLTA